MTKTVEIKIGDLRIGGKRPLFLIAGPCVIEEEDAFFRIAQRLKQITQELDIPFIFKSSYDKANRLNVTSYRGPGLKQGLKILARVKRELNLPVLSDVHSEAEVGPAAETLDVIQIPALLCRQTDLVLAAAKTGKPINLKKGQFMAPADMKNLIEKITSAGNNKIILTERGTSFGYNNLVSDMRALPLLRSFGYPVVYDASHSVQLPGGGGTHSGGEREMIPHLARAAVAAGCDGIFLEVHEKPDTARCDGPNMLQLNQLPQLLTQLLEIHRIVSD